MDDEELSIAIVLALVLLGGGSSSKPKPTNPNDPTPPLPPPPTPKPPTPTVDPDSPYDPAWFHASPKPGKLYKVQKGDNGEERSSSRGIAHRAITDRVYTLELGRGHDHASALQLASAASTATSRANFWHRVQCMPFNDRLYGTFGYGSQADPSSNGRAVRLTPVHSDNHTLLAQGKPLERRIALKTPNDARKGNATGAGSSYELLQLPDIDDAVYLETGALAFKDTTPTELRNWPVNDRSGAPQGVQWGC